MAYQVIARKYRPQRFADVVGQEHVTLTLTHAIEQKRIAHAYLFCGPRGTGKTTIARIFAMCLNCTGGPKVDFAADDPRCREIAEGRSLDVLEIDGASNNGVEQVRELRETCKYAPASSKFKIYIIDEVHMLSTAAFNALLKTLEEPPAHVKFMFATTDPEKVLATILSRCQRFDLRRIPAALIVKHLTHIAKLEQVKIDDAALYAIARGADGGMRDAESALDQLISFCGDKIEEADVLSMFGLTAQGQILELSRAVLAGEISPALHQLHDLSQHGKDLGRLLADLLNHFRNLLLFQVARGDLNMLEVSEAEVTSLKEQASLASTEALTRILEVLADAEIRLRDAASKKILIEITLLKAIQARSAVSLDAVLKQLQQMRGEGTPAASLAPAASPATPASSKQTSPARPAQQAITGPLHEPTHPRPLQGGEQNSGRTTAVPLLGGVRGGSMGQMRDSGIVEAPPEPQLVPLVETAQGSVDLGAFWPQLVEAVTRASRFTGGYLLNAHPVSFGKNLFTIGFDPEFEDQLGLVDNAKSHALLQTKLAELGHPNAQIKFVKAEAPVGRVPTGTQSAPDAPPAPARPTAPPAAPKPVVSAAPASKERLASVPFHKDDFKNDPLIQKALEIFKGQIVEVRA